MQYALSLYCIICMISSRPRLELQPQLFESMERLRHWLQISGNQHAAGKSMELASRIRGQMFKFWILSSPCITSILCSSSLILVLSSVLPHFCFHFRAFLRVSSLCTSVRCLSTLHIYHEASWYYSRSYGRHQNKEIKWKNFLRLILGKVNLELTPDAGPNYV